jgi:hypothetical protein
VLYFLLTEGQLERPVVAVQSALDLETQGTKGRRAQEGQSATLALQARAPAHWTTGGRKKYPAGLREDVVHPPAQVRGVDWEVVAQDEPGPGQDLADDALALLVATTLDTAVKLINCSV